MSEKIIFYFAQIYLIRLCMMNIFHTYTSYISEVYACKNIIFFYFASTSYQSKVYASKHDFVFFMRVLHI